MHLSKRLKAVVDMVTPGNRVADIGCDHAYSAIYLLKNKISPYVIAMDINQGPLERAKENVERFDVADKISIRKSDGLEMLNKGEVDTLLIAGMGGRLMLQILNSHMDIVSEVKELVLQPQSELHLVRKVLNELGYVIIKENMLKEDGKYYFIMKLKYPTEDFDITDYKLTSPWHIHFGKLLLEERNTVLYEYLMKERRLYIKLYNELSSLPTVQSIMR